MPRRRGTLFTVRARKILMGAALLAVLGTGSVALVHTETGQASQAGDQGAAAGLPVAEAALGANQATPGPGALTEIDKTFLVKVRQAGLWEIPAGKLAQTHASSEAVKRAGLHVIDGHSKLDQLVREDANILGVPLPDQATPEQQGWVRQLTDAQGLAFDKLFANLLRSSHGKIFATIGEVRASTQNDLIRRHARQANQTVLDHMEVLEDTGLVSPETFADVATAVAPAK
jgi:predicted outer membrane protein